MYFSTVLLFDCSFFCFFFSSRRRHTCCALVTGVQTCALPILPICPGDCLSPSRHAFYPQSNHVSAALAHDHGQAIREAGRRFAEACFDEIGIDKAPGLISRAMFALPGMTKDLAARNISGIMLGATQPTLGRSEEHTSELQS